MNPSASFEDLMARLRAGDGDAAAQLFHRFTHRLIGLARSRLEGPIRRKVDPEDVLQSVYRSFFRRHAQGEFNLDGWDSLWGLLAVITLRKCGRWQEHFRTARRNLKAEENPSDPAAGGVPSEALADEPTPAEAAMLTETVEELLAGLQERDRAIVTLALQGYSAVEISAQLGLIERTVYRVLERVKKRLERLRSGEES
jgi:RNA polymerase sigma-70 factor (ECF subfamily)